MKQTHLLQGYQTKAVGADVTSVRCAGKWLPLGISVDAVAGMTLGIDNLPGEEAAQLKAWLAPILEAVNADVLVSDDADAFKKVSDETGRAHQVCKSHVGNNTDDLVAELSAILQAGQDHSLDVIQVSPEQALTDLALLKALLHSRQPNDQPILEQLYLLPRANPAEAKNITSPIGCAASSSIAGRFGRDLLSIAPGETSIAHAGNHLTRGLNLAALMA